jgi:2-acylglycerol O-acyltransferase 2
MADLGPADVVVTPRNTLLRRAFEVTVVTWHTLCIPILTLLFLYVSTFRPLWPFLLPYIISLFFFRGHESGTLPLRSNSLRSSRVWNLFATYFPATLHRSVPLSATRNYIFGYHPHGIIAHGAFLAFCTEALNFTHIFPGITSTLLTLDANFRIPLYREYALALGLAGVSSRSCRNLLRKGGPRGDGTGRAITIVVGGARESMIAVPKSLRLMVKDRKGFIKLALRTGTDLVPVLAFGENDLYSHVDSEKYPSVQKVQRILKDATGWEMPLFFGQGIRNGSWGFLAYRRPIDIVVGRPIEVNAEVEEPGDEEIDRVHELYLRELERMWEEWRGKFPATVGVELELL